ncbi:MAG: FAD-dependent oxidoreductase [Pseudomonadota bacterium]
MSDRAAFVIIGGGQAAAQLAQSLRKGGYAGRLVMIAEEGLAPYQRPPLSKAYLAGNLSAERLALLKPAQIEKLGLEMIYDSAQAIDTGAKTVSLKNGDPLIYQTLFLATGATVRPLTITGAGLDGVFYMRSKADADALKVALDNFSRMVVIGGGFIGLEAAAVLRKMGKSVTVIEMADRLMARAISPELSAAFLTKHQNEGVDVRLGAVAASIGGSTRVEHVKLESGDTIAADLVIAGIGVVPEVSIAADAGLETADTAPGGIMVGPDMRTSNADIFACGDNTVFTSRFFPRPLRLESVQNAIDQAKVAAAAALGGAANYEDVPWFWSDQFDWKLQIAGLWRPGLKAYRRGSPETGKGSFLHYDKDTLVAVESVGAPGDHTGARKLLAAEVSPSPTHACNLDHKLIRLISAEA